MENFEFDLNAFFLTQVRMPNRGDTKSFVPGDRSDRKAFKSAFTMFFDFESLQVEPERQCSCSDETLLNTRALEAKLKRRAGMDPRDISDDNEMENHWRNAQIEAEKRGARFRGEKFKMSNIPSYGRRSEANVCKHKTFVKKVQPPFVYSFIVVDREGKVVEHRRRAQKEGEQTGDDLAKQFLEDVLDASERWLPSLSPGHKMVLTDQDRKIIQKAQVCYLCRSPLKKDRVLDHDHLTGNFLGVAHNMCNLERQEQYRMACYAHNFSGYDSHFLIKAMKKMPDRIKDINAIPLNMQKFKCLTINDRIHFLDSTAFLGDGLANLVNMLKKDGSAFPILSQMSGMTGERKALMTQKGVYPYSFATSVSRLFKTKELPPRAEFFNDLCEEECSEEDYGHAEVVWAEWGCGNMMDYTNLYIDSDVYLLADVIVKFRNDMWDAFNLDMCKYLSLPHMALDIMLKETDVEIELIWDREMMDLLMENIRGGLSYANLRHATSERVDPDENMDVMMEDKLSEWGSQTAFREWLADRRGKQYEERYEEMKVTEGHGQRLDRTMAYLDANNLYGYAMTGPLPLRDFRWMTERELATFKPESDVSWENGDGYILEVDLEYPPELHEKHSTFPLAPHEMIITEEHLSPYSRECLAKAGKLKTGSSKYSAKKLTSTFLPRKKYLVHGLNLQFYLRQGMKVTKYHRGIKFYQEDFIRPFIEKCTKKRMEALTVTEQTMWKLICNSVYGKLIESAMKRMNVYFDQTPVDAVKHASSPLYKGCVVLDRDLTLSFQQKKKVKLDQCYAVGFSILELSKLHMQRLWYEEVVPKLDDFNLGMIMSDTDSFLFVAQGRGNEAEIMEKLTPVMDFSNYPKDHPLFNDSRKKVPGFLKNELPTEVIEEAVALRSKSYAMRLRPLRPTEQDYRDRVQTKTNKTEIELEKWEKGRELYRCKGVSKRAQHKLSLAKYKKCITSIDSHQVEQYSIRSKDHTNELVKSTKLCFSSFDDKRYLLCSVHSVPYGSALIREQEAAAAVGVGCIQCYREREVGGYINYL